MLNGRYFLSVLMAVSVSASCFGQAPVSAVPVAVPASPDKCAVAPAKVVVVPVKADACTTPPDHLTPPLIWGCDNEWKLQFGGDVSFRAESRQNFYYPKLTNSGDALQFLRARVNFDLTYRNLVQAFVEIIDARVYNYTTDPLQSDSWDVYQAFLAIKYYENCPYTLRVGRMMLPAISEGRVFGVPPSVDLFWFNMLPLFQGANLEYKDKDWTAYTFLLQQVVPQAIHDDVLVNSRFNKLDHSWFYGVYANCRALAPHDFDLYFLGLSDQEDMRTFPKPVKDENGFFGTSDRYTVGSRWRGPIYKDECGTLGYGLEGAYQFGHVAEDRISAWMGHADINYAWNQPWKPKLMFLGNLASGDKTPGDGVSNTFNPLFGSSHYGYGIIDFTKLQNLRELALTGSIEPCKNWRFNAGLHQFWLDSPNDAWYTALGVPFGRDKAGTDGDALGHEFDIYATYTPNKYLTCETGFAHFMPGDFAKNTGHTWNANFIYAQACFKF